MYTQCPACRTIFEVDEDVLQASLGIVRCGNCGERFDALRTLSDAVPAGPEPILAERDPETFAPVLTQRVAPPAARSAAAATGAPEASGSDAGEPPARAPDTHGTGDAQLAARSGSRARALIAEAAGIGRDALLEDPAWQVTELPVLTAIILQDPISPADLDDAAGMLTGTTGATTQPLTAPGAARDFGVPSDAAPASAGPTAPVEAPQRRPAAGPMSRPAVPDAPATATPAASPPDAPAPAPIATAAFLLVEDVATGPDAPEPTPAEAGAAAGVPPQGGTATDVPPDPPLPAATDVPAGAGGSPDPSPVIPARTRIHPGVDGDRPDSGSGPEFGSEPGTAFLHRADGPAQDFVEPLQSVPNAPAAAATPVNDAAPSDGAPPLAAIPVPVVPDDTPRPDAPEDPAAPPDAAGAAPAVRDDAPQSGDEPPESPFAEAASGSVGVAAIADGTATDASDADLSPSLAVAPAPDSAAAPENADADAAPPEPLYVPPRARGVRRGDWAWIIGCIVLALALALQLAWAQRADFVRNPGTRGWALDVCARIACRLPPISDPAKLVLVSRDIRPDPQHPGLLSITATIRNDAPFRQPWPVVVVRMTDIDDRVVAMRRFRAADYQPDAARRASGIAPATTAMVAFDVRDPGRRATGFRFDFE